MERDSFIFYRSFAEAIDDLPDNEQLEVYRAIKEYALNEREIDLTGMAKGFWTLIKPQIIANNRRYKNGMKGGRPPERQKPNYNQKGTKRKPNNNLNGTEPKPTDIQGENQMGTKRKPNENVNDNVNVNANGNVNDLSGSGEPPGETRPSKQKPDKPKKPPLREREPENDYEQVEKAYWTNWDALYSHKRVKTPDPIVNWGQTRKLLKTHFEKLKPEQIIQAVNNGMKDKWIMDHGYSLELILKSSTLNSLINATHGAPSKRHQEKLSLED